jgi:hypothetical protein
MVAPGIVANDLTADGTNLGFICDGGICSVSEQGGAIHTLPTMGTSPAALAMDSQFTYWPAALSGAVLRTQTNGQGTPTVISSAVQPVGVVVDSASAYFIDQNGLSSVPKSGGTPTVTVSSVGSVSGVSGLFEPMFTQQGLIFASGDNWPNDGTDLVTVTPPNAYTLTYEQGLVPMGFGLLAPGQPDFLLITNTFPAELFWYAITGRQIAIRASQPTNGSNGFGDPIMGQLQAALPASCGVVAFATGGASLNNPLWWAPLRTFASNIELPALVPIYTAFGSVSMVSDNGKLFVADVGTPAIVSMSLP